MYNHSDFVNYYFTTKCLSGTFIKTCKEQLYVMFFKVYWQLTIGKNTPETSLVFKNFFY